MLRKTWGGGWSVITSVVLAHMFHATQHVVEQVLDSMIVSSSLRAYVFFHATSATFVATLRQSGSFTDIFICAIHFFGSIMVLQSTRSDSITMDCSDFCECVVSFDLFFNLK